ncbi:UBP-type zinc finger domain-containing protein [Nocardioides sp. GXZ039]|uniref:UBP-type zinc finger domain-containing protein n=1 Tax=Nocardioides sp. GXZ039 TaxID=3136018 RepID=UPI0030F49A7D
MTDTEAIDLSVPPSGPGCVECDAAGGWWVHLRRCAACGHVGCCDSSPSQHATAHYESTGHPVMQSFEPGEDWLWDFASQSAVALPDGVSLAAPTSHPEDQPAPGPRGRVPQDWRSQIH